MFYCTVALLLYCSAAQSYAAPAEVWETGQTKCYQGVSPYAEIACAGTRQDGDKKAGVAWPIPRFTDNGNGTVTDNLTGLIWLKNANCFSWKTWQAALDSSNALASSQCGLSDGSQAGDWRLPNRKELLSLVDYSKFYPALPASHPFTNAQSSYYWSSSTVALYTGNAWVVNMGSGYVHYYIKAGSLYVWPVRGGQSGSFCNLAIAPSTQTFTSSGGTGSVTVTASASSCAWTATSSLSWVTITSGSSGTGNGTVQYSVSANTTGATKTGTITIAGQTFTIMQADGRFLSFPLPNRDSSSAVINTVFDHSMTKPYCANGVIIAYNGDQSSDTSKIDSSCTFKTYNYADKYSYFPRPANISNYNTSYTSLSYDGHPGYDYKTTDQCADGKINVLAAADGNITLLGCLDTTNPDCYGTIEIYHGNNYKTRYLHLSKQNVTYGQHVTRGQVIGISGYTGSPGSPHLHFEVRNNDIPVDPYGWQPKNGTDLDPYTLLNTGVINEILWSSNTTTCTYTLCPASQTFTTAGGTGSVTVTASSNSCAWTASSSLSWATITSGSGTGSGTAGFTVSANTTGASRTGNLTIAGQTFTITQKGKK